MALGRLPCTLRVLSVPLWQASVEKAGGAQLQAVLLPVHMNAARCFYSPFTRKGRLQESGAGTRRPVVGAGHSLPQPRPWGEGMGLPGLAVRGYLIRLQEVAPHPMTCPAPSPLPRQNQPRPVCVAQGGQGLENQQVVLGSTSDPPCLPPSACAGGHRQARVSGTLPLLPSLTAVAPCQQRAGAWLPLGASEQLNRMQYSSQTSGFYLHRRT